MKWKSFILDLISAGMQRGSYAAELFFPFRTVWESVRFYYHLDMTPLNGPKKRLLCLWMVASKQMDISFLDGHYDNQGS